MVLLDSISDHIGSDVSLTWIITIFATIVGAVWRFTVRDKSQCAQIKILKQSVSDLESEVDNVKTTSDRMDREQGKEIKDLLGEIREIKGQLK